MASPQPLLSAEQMAMFERDGAILVDTPFSEAEMDKIEGAWDSITNKESTTVRCFWLAAGSRLARF